MYFLISVLAVGFLRLPYICETRVRVRVRVEVTVVLGVAYDPYDPFDPAVSTGLCQSLVDVTVVLGVVAWLSQSLFEILVRSV